MRDWAGSLRRGEWDVTGRCVVLWLEGARGREDGAISRGQDQPDPYKIGIWRLQRTVQSRWRRSRPLCTKNREIDFRPSLVSGDSGPLSEGKVGDDFFFTCVCDMLSCAGVCWRHRGTLSDRHLSPRARVVASGRCHQPLVPSSKHLLAASTCLGSLGGSLRCTQLYHGTHHALPPHQGRAAGVARA